MPRLITTAAYAKLLLHACKYPSRPVLGLLVGAAEDDERTVTDCIPLFHNYTAAPMVEMALMQVEQYCKNHGLVMLGLYSGNERYEDNAPSLQASKLGSKLAEVDAQAVLLLVENKRIDHSDGRAAISTFSAATSKRSPEEQQYNPTDDTMKRTMELIASQAQSQVVDFEAHLQDGASDWLKPLDV